MSQLLQFVLLGVGIGAIYGLAALGVVLIHVGSKVVNFAQGGIALVAAVIYYQAHVAGVPEGPAIVLAIAAAVVCGALVELLIMRPMAGAATSSKVIVTIALMLVLQYAVALLYGGLTKFVPAILPVTTVSVLGAPIGVDRLLLVGIGLAFTIALRLLYKRTRFGLATAAAAEDQLGASALGFSPRRLALYNWMLGAGLAGVAGVLVAPILSITPTSLIDIVFPALAAALIGAFTSFTITFAAAIVLGIVQSLAIGYVGATGWSTAVPFLVLFAVVFLRARRTTTRADRVERQPKVGAGTTTPLTIGVCFGAVMVLCLLLGVNWVNALTVTLIFGLLGLSVVLVTGYSGQVSLCQFSFAGIGALVAAHVSASWGLPFLACLAFAMVAAGCLGLFFALPAVRSRGPSLSIITLGLAASLEALVFGNSSLNGGFSGITVQTPTVFGINVDPVANPGRYAIVCLIIATVAGLAVSNVRRGAAGRFLLATRHSEQAAESLGVNAAAAKLFGFGLSACIAGVGGALLAFQSPTVFLTPFTLSASVALIVSANLAGIAYINGGYGVGLGAVGGLTWYALTYLHVEQYLPLALAFLVLIQIVMLPDGLGDINVKNAERVRRRLGLRSHIRRPVAVAPRTATRGEYRTHVLSVEDVSASFGGVQALQGVGLELRSGEVVGVIGPNGSGKTTLLDAIAGVNRRYGGVVKLDGRDLRSLSPYRRARAGLGRSFQDLRLIDDLTVGENVCLAAEGRKFRGYLRDVLRPRGARLEPFEMAALESFELADDLDRYPGELPYARRRLLAVARALAGASAFILLDEPAAGLDRNERVELRRLIEEAARKLQVGVLLVEHDVGLVFASCDRIVVLSGGKVLASGSAEEIRHDRTVSDIFLGEDEPEPAQRPPAPTVVAS
jgi:sulfate-transporting ATPase